MAMSDIPIKPPLPNPDMPAMPDDEAVAEGMPDMDMDMDMEVVMLPVAIDAMLASVVDIVSSDTVLRNLTQSSDTCFSTMPSIPTVDLDFRASWQ